jgi:hypothetical protein
MPKQFENPEAAKLENETVSDANAEKRIDRVAEKAAGKATQTVQKFDKDHKIVSH